MRALITGGAGFIGSHVAQALLERGDAVAVIDNFATSRRDSLAAHGNLKVVEASIADEGVVQRLFEEFKPDRVVHAAASYKDPENWIEDARTNTLGTVHVVRAALRAKVSRFVYFQTSLCYGLHPLQSPIRLDHPIRPEASSYAITKTAAEHYIQLSGLDFISFRLANVYGPRNLSGPLPTFFHRLTSGKPCFVMDTRRDFLYVEDLLGVVMKALDGKGARGAYHVSSGSDVSIKELYDVTLKVLGINTGSPVEVRPRGKDDAFTILLDPARTNEDFAWKTEVALETGVRRAIDWYRSHGVTQTFTHLKMADGPLKS